MNKLEEDLDKIAYEIWQEYEDDLADSKYDVSDYIYFAVLEGAQFYKKYGWQYEQEAE